jgi:uracil permease
MLQKVDLGQDKNMFVASTILIAGIGGLSVSFGKVTLTSVACALILGIVVNVMLSKVKDEEAEE